MVLILFAGQIAAGFWMYKNHGKFYTIFEKSIAESIQKDYSAKGMELKTKAFDILQREVSQIFKLSFLNASWWKKNK